MRRGCADQELAAVTTLEKLEVDMEVGGCAEGCVRRGTLVSILACAPNVVDLSIAWPPAPVGEIRHGGKGNHGCSKVLASLCTRDFPKLKRLTLKNALVERGSVDVLRCDRTAPSSSSGTVPVKKKSKDRFTLQLIRCQLIGDVLGLLDDGFEVEDVCSESVSVSTSTSVSAPPVSVHCTGGSTGAPHQPVTPI